MTNSQRPITRRTLFAGVSAVLPGALMGAQEDRKGAKQARTAELVAAAAELRRKFENDPLRPRFHYMPPSGQFHDVNGVIFWKGRYHLFYQFKSPLSKGTGKGHASSVDLVHWVEHPLMMVPDPNGPDRIGCYSGRMFFDDSGRPSIIYFGNPDGICIATSADDDLNRWTKHPANPVLKTPQAGQPDFGQYRLFDPCVWKKGGKWYMLTGGVAPEGGEIAYLFESADLFRWRYLHPFYKSDRRWTQKDEDLAVPQFFPMAGKHVLLWFSHPQRSQYYIGRYEGERFVPEAHDRINWPAGNYHAAGAFEDRKGRTLILANLNEGRFASAYDAAGWSEAMSLPSSVKLAPDSSRLLFEPIPELEVLRYDAIRIADIRLKAGEERVLSQISGDCLEIDMRVTPSGPGAFGLKVRCAPDGQEETLVICDVSEQLLKIDFRKASLDPSLIYAEGRWGDAVTGKPARQLERIQKAPCPMQSGREMRIRVFLDRSILEVFVNGRYLAQRIYPTRKDSTGIALFAHGQPFHAGTFQCWHMAQAHAG